jgi:hypothetical protein
MNYITMFLNTVEWWGHGRHLMETEKCASTQLAGVYRVDHVCRVLFASFAMSDHLPCVCLAHCRG